jgi:multicomponent K+:H+ antiporter subunit G
MSTDALPMWLDLSLSALVLLGASFALIGSVGLARLSEFFTRMHGPTKATTLGVGCVLVASTLWFSVRGEGVSLHELLITCFLFLTAPISAHMLARAALSLSPRHRPPLPVRGAQPTTKDQPSELPNDQHP